MVSNSGQGVLTWKWESLPCQYRVSSSTSFRQTSAGSLYASKSAALSPADFSPRRKAMVFVSPGSSSTTAERAPQQLPL